MYNFRTMARREPEVLSDVAVEWQSEIIQSPVNDSKKDRHAMIVAIVTMSFSGLTMSSAIAATVFTGGIALPASATLFVLGLALFNRGIKKYNKLMTKRFKNNR